MVVTERKIEIMDTNWDGNVSGRKGNYLAEFNDISENCGNFALKHVVINGITYGTTGDTCYGYISINLFCCFEK